MSTVTEIRYLEKQKDKFLKPKNFSEMIGLIGRKDIPEEILLYHLEIENNNKKIHKIEKFENIRDREIKETKIKHFDKKEIEARKKMCEVFGMEYENEISNSNFRNTEGILSKFVNNKIDPVNLLRNIRES
ncbi:MAG: hypothetical protein R2685_04975 [Candidatus Nitrosocosmicus sp.]|nr:hypothetical protein [Candidatus Nitrosocosmicus sp.]